MYRFAQNLPSEAYSTAIDQTSNNPLKFQDKDIIERAKQILISPKTEWPVIKAENDSHLKVLTSYLLWLAMIPAVAAFIGYGIIGYNILGIHIHSAEFGIRQAVVSYITYIAGCYISAAVITLLAESFGAKKDFNRAFQLVAYAYTASCIGGIFNIYHSLTIIATLCGIYSLYLLYTGLEPMTEVTPEKKAAYFIVSMLCMIAVYFVVGLILAAIFLPKYQGFAF